MTKTCPVLQLYPVHLENEKFNVTIKNLHKGNQYLNVEKNVWVRNFTLKNILPIDINNLNQEEEIKTFINNQLINNMFKLPKFEAKDLSNKNVFIVSDGFGFENINNILENINIKNKFIILTNNSLKKWNNFKVLPDLFIENNPYKNSLNNINPKIFPNCLLSKRIYPEFINSCKSKNISFYDPIPSLNFNSMYKNEINAYLDDYRNPICAAINYCFLCNAKNINLLYCSEGMDKERPASYLHNDGIHYQYNQNKLSDKIINGMIFWYKKTKQYSNIFYHGLNKSFKFGSYIQQEDLIENFKL
jgi:hypothetical protein